MHVRVCDEHVHVRESESVLPIQATGTVSLGTGLRQSCVNITNITCTATAVTVTQAPYIMKFICTQYMYPYQHIMYRSQSMHTHRKPKPAHLAFGRHAALRFGRRA